MYGKASAWPRVRNTQDLPAKACEHCDSEYRPVSGSQKYCSTRCSTRAHHLFRALREGKTLASVTLAEARNCAWCEQPYHHSSKQRVHCSDLCRDESRVSRGSTLHRGWIHKSIRLSIYQRDDHKCWLCGGSVDYLADPKRDDWAPSLDHVTPRSKGGTHESSNLRTAHRWCNSVRSDNEQHDLFLAA
ncbi:HNH endonuclease [Pseudarthrobacter sp. NPDC055928]|uniref:HNH endonuclease n=1 Tax=Pseudarthrobacter sp. NPDC055928 TaxID=3345661 RepID=UPI0035DA8C8F